MAKKAKSKRQRKIDKVMAEFRAGRLKTSHGKKVTSAKQAFAIANSEADRMK